MRTNSRPRFKTTPENLQSLIERTRRIEEDDLFKLEVEADAHALLSELRGMHLKFGDLADEDDCLACLSMSLSRALMKLEEIQSKQRLRKRGTSAPKGRKRHV